MTFEMILPKLKNGAKIIRQGWGGTEEFVLLVSNQTFLSETVTPYFLIKTSDEGYSMFSPTVCDILADDWSVVAE